MSPKPPGQKLTRVKCKHCGHSPVEQSKSDDGSPGEMPSVPTVFGQKKKPTDSHISVGRWSNKRLEENIVAMLRGRGRDDVACSRRLSTLGITQYSRNQIHNFTLRPLSIFLCLSMLGSLGDNLMTSIAKKSSLIRRKDEFRGRSWAPVRAVKGESNRLNHELISPKLNQLLKKLVIETDSS